MADLVLFASRALASPWILGFAGTSAMVVHLAEGTPASIEGCLLCPQPHSILAQPGGKIPRLCLWARQPAATVHKHAA